VTRGSPLSSTLQPSQTIGVANRKPLWMVAFIVLSALVMAFSVYIVLIDQDLTALLVGILIVSIVYPTLRFVGRLGQAR
jgi:hypothetical protein